MREVSIKDLELNYSDKDKYIWIKGSIKGEVNNILTIVDKKTGKEENILVIR